MYGITPTPSWDSTPSYKILPSPNTTCCTVLPLTAVALSVWISKLKLSLAIMFNHRPSVAGQPLTLTGLVDVDAKHCLGQPLKEFTEKIYTGQTKNFQELLSTPR